MQHSSLQRNIYFVTFKHIKKQFQGIKTKPTSSANQLEISSSWEVAEGTLCPCPSDSGSAHLLPTLHSELLTYGRLADSCSFIIMYMITNKSLHVWKLPSHIAAEKAVVPISSVHKFDIPYVSKHLMVFE